MLLTAGALLPTAAIAAEWVRLPEHSNGLNRVLRRLMPGSKPSVTRSVVFYNLHTSEHLSAVYFENGRYIPDALQEVNYFFRDFRVNQVKPIDPRLLDLLYELRLALDTPQPFNLISGYRSALTNAMLASRSEGVARHSMHIEGRAADINVPGRDLQQVQRVALAIQGGGVGYYPHSGFVHVDTGRVRRW
ncbi:MAG: DUF882 domain-containing protein [Bryobacterales bacterium]|nr:DUF882 domain-containing protein [Bryobacterales bacterium]